MNSPEIEEWFRAAYDDDERTAFVAIKQSLLSSVPETRGHGKQGGGGAGNRKVFRTLRPLLVAQGIANPWAHSPFLAGGKWSGIERLVVLRSQLVAFFDGERGGAVLPIPTPRTFRTALGDGARLGAAAWPVIAFLRQVVALDERPDLSPGDRAYLEHCSWLEAMHFLNLRTPSQVAERVYRDLVQDVVRSELKRKRRREDVEDAVGDVHVQLAGRVRNQLLHYPPRAASLRNDEETGTFLYWAKAVRNAARSASPGAQILEQLSDEDGEHPLTQSGGAHSIVGLPIPPSSHRNLAAEQRDNSERESLTAISDRRAAAQRHDPGDGRWRLNAIAKEEGCHFTTIKEALKRALDAHPSADPPEHDHIGPILNAEWKERVLAERRRSQRTGPARTVASAAAILGQPVDKVLKQLRILHWHGSAEADEVDLTTHDVTDDELRALTEFFRQEGPVPSG